MRRASEGNWACGKCGNVYAIESTKWPGRDRGQLNCECGEKIVSWSGSTDYDKTLTGKVDPSEAASRTTFRP